MFTSRIGRVFTNFEKLPGCIGFHTGRTTKILENVVSNASNIVELTRSYATLYVNAIMLQSQGKVTITVSIWAADGSEPTVIDSRQILSSDSYTLEIPQGRLLIVETSGHENMLVNAVLHEFKFAQ